MKIIIKLFIIAIFTGSLSMSSAQFIDLSTGKTIELVKHQGNGMMMNPITQRPVYIYVNSATNDTVYGRTGEIINGKVSRSATGEWMYNDDAGYIYRDGEFRMKTEADSADYKKKMQSDGDVKVKYNGYKRKVEADGDVKEKEINSKTKVEADGTIKEKDGNFRGKVDSKGNVRLKDDSLKIKAKTDGKIKVKDKREDYKGKIDGDDGDLKEKQGDMKRKEKQEKVKEKNTEVIPQ